MLRFLTRATTREAVVLTVLVSAASASFAQWILLSVCIREAEDPLDKVDDVVYAGTPAEVILPSADELNAQCDNRTFDYGPAYTIHPDVMLPDYNYNLTKIRVGIVDRPPYHFKVRNKTSGQDEWFGVAIDALNIMKDRLNFTYELVTPPRNEIGNMKSDGNWTGLIGMIVRGEVDMGAALMHMSAVRLNAVEFSPALGEAGYAIMVKRPGKTHKSDALLAPFTAYVWILILVASLLMGPVIYFLVYARVFLCKGNVDTEYRWWRHNQLLSVSEYIWFVYGAILRQGSVLNPLSDSTRIMFATWWIFVTVLSAFYTANLTAFLTLAKYNFPISSIADVAKAPEVTWVARGGGEIEQMIRYEPKNKNESDSFASLRTSITPGSFVSPSDANFSTNALAAVEAGRIVYIDSRDVLRYMVIKDYKELRFNQKQPEGSSCRFIVVDDDISKYKLAFAYPKKPKFRHSDNFGPYIRRMLESGLVQQWRNKLFPDAEICELVKGFQERSLNNTDLLSTYLVTLYGLVAALVFFVVERIYRFFKSRQRDAAGAGDGGGGRGTADKASGSDDGRVGASKISKVIANLGNATDAKTREGIARQVFAGLPPTAVSRFVASGRPSVADKTDFPHLTWASSSSDKASDKAARPSAFSWTSSTSGSTAGGVVTIGYDEFGNQVNFVNDRPYVFVKVDGQTRAIRADKALARRY